MKFTLIIEATNFNQSSFNHGTYKFIKKTAIVIKYLVENHNVRTLIYRKKKYQKNWCDTFEEAVSGLDQFFVTEGLRTLSSCKYLTRTV